MIHPPVAPDENRRLDVLESYKILDTHAEAAFDALTRAAAALCDAPIAAISLVDRDREWFKSLVGHEAEAIPRDVSFCAHAIGGENVFEVPDALADPRFRDNPLVEGDPRIRFYAGTPLSTPEGLRIGTLCVIDRAPRQLTQRQRAALVELSRVVVHLLEQRKAGIAASARLVEADRLNATGQKLARFGWLRVDSAAQGVQASEGLFPIFGWRQGDPVPTYSEGLRLFHPEDRDEIFARGHIARTGGEGYSGEYRLSQPDGSQRDVSLWVEPERRDDGSLGTFAVIQDITERKAAEREAARTRERFDAIFNLVGDGILVSDPATGRFVEVNEAACSMFGYTRAELLECDIGDISSGVHPYTLEVAIARNREGREGETRAFEWNTRNKNGELFWCEISLRYVRLGGVPAVLALAHDISRRKRNEQELIEAKERAERANRAKSDFLAVMSHEIRTPMNGVIGMNALLLESNLTPPQRKMAETVQASAGALMHLLDEILDVAKLEAGQVKLEEAVFDLPAMVAKTVELIGPRAAQKGVSLSVRIDASAQGSFLGARNGLRQILLNLLANAVKFTDAGFVEIAVAAAPLKGSRVRLRFEVRDSGIGVSDEAKGRLFGAFEQADPSISDRYGGTGLGLHICRKLVDLMGGQIGVLDRPGGGSIFWFEVDLARDAAAAPVEGPAEIAGPIAGPRSAGRILLAEDDAVNVEVASLILTSAGYQVEVARNGAEALAAARARDFDLILMDQRMPVMDGLDATRAIRALPPPRGRRPILALTANAGAQDRERCLGAGMDDFIIKPFAPNVLREAVAQWIDGAARGTEPPTPFEEAPVIDIAVIEELRSVMSESQFAALARMFVTRAQAQLEAFAQARAASDAPDIADEAHKIVSSAGALGARRVQKIASRLEIASREGDLATAPALIETLAQALTEAGAELRRRFAAEPEAVQSPPERCVAV